MASKEEIVDNDIQTLSDLFDKGLKLYNEIGNNQLPSNSMEFQLDVKKAIKIFEKSTQLVSIADVFSKNEGFEEVASNDLKYFLLPALLGSLVLKLTSGDRRQIVDVAEVYFKDFLNRTNDYGLSNFVFKDKENVGQEVEKIREPRQNELDQLADAVNTRAHKIQRYKEQNQLKAKLEELKNNMENENIDDDVKKNYFLTMIKLFIHEAIDELGSIDMEKPILEHMANIKKDDETVKPLKRPPAPLKPFIITRDEVQKAVYGAGYPGLATMTVQEFYDKRVADGVFPDPTKPPNRNPNTMSLQEKALAGVPINDEESDQAREESLVEEDDDENLARMRAKDEFKDEHRRGWGNRMNRS
ncbi:unnamed protein product [Brassicogethes aeneus]|uniref:Immunoglobulin-binding protein 1 n=1 Tax=Brassicogethes aeneus TaxID=1431903 RepID=A0A9P0B6B6_BRAAE|nr:unnamed protein product [Brassicogethes aeneus]